MNNLELRKKIFIKCTVDYYMKLNAVIDFTAFNKNRLLSIENYDFLVFRQLMGEKDEFGRDTKSR